jgi:hypothetical protein
MSESAGSDDSSDSFSGSSETFDSSGVSIKQKFPGTINQLKLENGKKYVLSPISEISINLEGASLISTPTTSRGKSSKKGQLSSTIRNPIKLCVNFVSFQQTKCIIFIKA